jgi:hypothetical protein
MTSFQNEQRHIMKAARYSQRAAQADKSDYQAMRQMSRWQLDLFREDPNRTQVKRPATRWLNI